MEKEKITASRKTSEINNISSLRQEAALAPTFGSGVAPGRSKEELLRLADVKEKALSEFGLTEEEEVEQVHPDFFRALNLFHPTMPDRGDRDGQQRDQHERIGKD